LRASATIVSAGRRLILSANEKRAARRPEVPWITADGSFDVRKFPIDSILEHTLSEKLDEFRTGCTWLQSMHTSGRAEAGVYLLGLLRHYQNDLERLGVVVEKLQGYNTASCADALFSELRRVKSSNSTRGYLRLVLKTLSSFPYEIVSEELDRLVQDRSFTYKMRNKFRDIRANLRHGRRGF
jgi:hypothetical protein